ncbi:hypothetical protein [Streptomyces sp. NPDC000880]
MPPAVRRAFGLWAAAVGAGLFETVLAVGGLLADGSASGGEIVGGLSVRVAVFTTAILLAVQLRRGRNWARIGLAFLLGFLGTLSLVIQPVQWLAEGHSLGSALAEASVVDVMFGASRVLHLVAVIGAMVLMFQPEANAYFRARQR